MGLIDLHGKSHDQVDVLVPLHHRLPVAPSPHDLIPRTVDHHFYFVIDPPSARVLVHLRDKCPGVGGNGKKLKEIPPLRPGWSAPRKSRKVAAATMGRAAAHQYPVLPGPRPLLDRPVAGRVRAVDATGDIHG